VTTPASPYVARFQPTPLLMFSLAFWCLAAIGGLPASIFLWQATQQASGSDDASPFLTWVMIVILALCTVGGVPGVACWTVALVKKRAALRADADGVTLGGHPFPPGRDITVPWADLHEIVLYEEHVDNLGRRPFIGLRLRAGATCPRGVPRPGSFRAPRNRRRAEVGRHILGWRLDEAQLYQATLSYGPHVRLIAPGRKST